MEHIDAVGKRCPMPIVLLAKGIKNVGVGELITVAANDPVFEPDLRAWCEKTGHGLQKLEHQANGVMIGTIKRCT